MDRGENLDECSEVRITDTGETTLKSSEVLKAALERMDGGRKWTQCGRFYEGEKCCAYGALDRVPIVATYAPAINFLRKAVAINIAIWNDSASDFSVIEKGFERAISLAIAEGD